MEQVGLYLALLPMPLALTTNVIGVPKHTKMGDGLSKRESEVLSWLQQGMSNKEIALALEVSPRTVQKHLQRIYLHLDVHTRAEAIVRMRRDVRGA